jgi:hypothetical protein
MQYSVLKLKLIQLANVPYRCDVNQSTSSAVSNRALGLRLSTDTQAAFRTQSCLPYTVSPVNDIMAFGQNTARRRAVQVGCRVMVDFVMGNKCKLHFCLCIVDDFPLSR